jgi:hypothetical protein
MTLIQRVNDLAVAMGSYIKNNILPRLLPSGGTAGQVLAKTSGTNYAAGWVDKNVNFGFERIVGAFPTTNLFQGRIIEIEVNGIIMLYRYFVENTTLGITADWYPVISANGADDTDGTFYTGANESQIQSLYNSLTWVYQNGDATDCKVTELDISSGSGSFAISTNSNQDPLLGGIDRLSPRVVKNTASARAIAVSNPNNAVVNTTIPVSTGDILIPKYISSNNSWSYEVIPAPVADTDYVAIFNAALV